MQPSDEYGSPSLDELSDFSRAFADEYSIAMGAAADDVAVEVSSPVSPLLSHAMLTDDMLHC